MRKFITTIKLGALLCIAAMLVTSCLKDEKNDTVTFTGFFTITGSMPNYKLIEDGGAVVYPSAESINQLTNNKGFENYKRAQFYGTYDQNLDMTEDEKGNVTIKNAKLLGGQYIETKKVLDVDDAKNTNVLNNDSVFSILSFKQCWIANGYINTIINGQYSAKEGKAIRPTVNLLLGENAVTENTVSLTILYNRHSSKNENAAGTTDFINSFDITDIKVPGNDSILVTVNVNGATPAKVKVSRKAFE